MTSPRLEDLAEELDLDEDDGDRAGVDCWQCDGEGGWNAPTDDMGCGEDPCHCGLCDWEECNECEGTGVL